ncbi:DedA family protein [Chimaeribacter coloradensis]|uniref:DedA family protein n=1 Tax=Chimaeribacter coloradensis TaxID=2060068 RepID=A0A2N5E6G1_9GAMM|nr:DedA family protein [Chimaeribacter coloradensis]PLR36881.1 DedA family protein [Chimaeribacter coloradensis]
MPDIAHFITDYGYWALLAGCLLEGETITLLGGIAAHHGLLKLPWVLAVVAFGGCLGDQILYFTGRRFGPRLLGKLKRRQPQIERARQLINHHPALFVLGVRFMYGFRIIGPVIIGASKMPVARFVSLNILGACIWSLVWVLLGYFCGHFIENLLGAMDKKVSGALVIIGAVAFVLLMKFLLGRMDKNKQER